MMFGVGEIILAWSFFHYKKRVLTPFYWYLRYNEYLEQGMPIATGVIIGHCRHLIKDRMDITGARWSLSGTEAVLKLRERWVSDDFDDYWNFHEQQEFYRNHFSQYFNPAILEEFPNKFI